MANILYRGTIAPIQPASVAGGSVAKNSPLTNDEGDWNYKSLNDDIQTRAVSNNPSFTGVVSFNQNLRSTTAKFNQYISGISDTIPIGGCKIGEYVPAGDSQNATIRMLVTARAGFRESSSIATITIRSNTMPDAQATIYQSVTKNDALTINVELWKDATTGKFVFFAVPNESIQNISFNTEVYERTAANSYVQATTNIAKDSTGLTQIAGVSSIDIDTVSALSFKAPLASPALTGVPTAPTAVAGTNTTQLATTAFVNAFAPTKTGAGASGTWSINISGSADALNTSRADWATKNSHLTLVGQLAWRNFGNGHSIFDASKGLAPDSATAVGNTNADYPWMPNHPILMGWNGSATHGVRVDSARVADSSNSASATWVSAPINSSSANGNSSSSVEVRNAGGTGDAGLAAIAFHCTSAHGAKLHLRADGFFGLGGFSRAAWGWYLDGTNNMTCAGNVTAYSDPRLKENFKRIDDPMAILNKLDGGTFNWRHGFPHIAGKAGKRDYGILADQVQAVMPEIVTKSIDIDDEAYLTVAYDKLVPVLIEAVKCLEKRIAELEGK